MSPKQLQRLNGISTLNNWVASFPLSTTGEPLVNLGRKAIEAESYFQAGKMETKQIFRTAIQSYAVSTAKETLYSKYQSSHSHNPPDLSHFEFVANLNRLSRSIDFSSLFSSNEEKLIIIQQLFDVAQNTVKEEVLWTPFFRNRNDLKSQIDITKETNHHIETLGQEIRALERGENPPKLRLEHETPVVITNTIARAHLLPMAIPINSEKVNFDSGRCDIFLNTSFRKGERGIVLASYEDYRLISTFGSCGWLKSTDVATFYKDADLYKEVFYTGTEPLFYGGLLPKVLLPGDSLFLKETGIHVQERDELGNIALTIIPEIDSQTFTHNIETPQQLVNFLYALRLPYMYAIFDCSETIRRGFNLLGYFLRKYSGDLMEDLTKALGEGRKIGNSEELSELDAGLYIANLLAPNKLGQYTSRHVYLVTVVGTKIEAFSYAFSIWGDSGATEYPIGPHVCGKDALQHQLNKGRQIVFQKIARK